jgi:hypothetical protein
MSDELGQAAAATSMRARIWVLDGTIDFPVQTPRNDSGALTESMYLFLGGQDIDGFVETRPADNERSSKSVFWTASSPLVWRLRASVRAVDVAGGIIRGAELMEHVADRLAFMSGEMVRPLSIGMVYNEDQLRECMAGRREEFDCTTGGEFAFRTQHIRNAAFAHRILAPRPEALTALRWFRRGMSFQEKVDQFVAFYFALESIAEHLPDVQAEPLRCRECGAQYGESRTTAGIASLIARHTNFPPNARQHLAMLRARIVHGTANDDIRYNAAANAAAVQRLAADGIATVLGIDPAQINFGINPLGGLGGLQPSVLPLMRGKYDEQHSPLAEWGGRLHSDVFSEVSQHLTAQMLGTTPPSESAKTDK